MLKHLLIAAMAGGALPGASETSSSPLANPAPAPIVEPARSYAPPIPPTVAEEDRVIELAICLDTSGSMQGLINSAREKLWTIVNDLATAKPTPRLRVALLSFGNDGLSAENGWVQVVVPFTSDIDLLSDKLFGLTTNGGTELVGRVLDTAADQLDWSPSERVLKLCFVAGNESADQDQVIPFADACAKSIARGIQVNSIYCGPGTDGLAPDWQKVSALADGHFASIDHNKAIPNIVAPQDERIFALSAEFNGTTLPYGEQGEWGASNIERQDSNAMSCSNGSATSRAFTKCQTIYSNPHWDFVDAYRTGKVVLNEVNPDALPKELAGKTEEEIRAHVEALYEKRKKIQAEILELQTQREAFVIEERKKLALDAVDEFDRAVRSAIRAQAEAKGFVFATPSPSATVAAPQPTKAEAKPSLPLVPEFIPGLRTNGLGGC